MPSRATGSRRILRAATTVLLLPLLSIALVLGVFEVGLRIAGHRPIYEIYSKPSVFWVHHPVLGWLHQPGAVGEYVGPRPWPIEFRARVEINSLGLRGPEIPARRPGERRVLLLGDSMVAAFEVEYQETFGARLEERLAQRLASPVRVINAGVRGYGTDQAYLLFRELGGELDPDLVVFFHSANDPVDNVTLHEMRRPFGKPVLGVAADGRLTPLGVPVPRYPMCSEYRLLEGFEVVRVDTAGGRLTCHAQIALFDHSALFSFFTVAIPWDTAFLRRLYYLGNPHIDQLARTGGEAAQETFAGRQTLRIIAALAAEARRAGADLMIMGLPPHMKQLDAQRLADLGIDSVVLEEVARAPQHEVSWHHDSHFNPEGHRRVGETLLDPVEQKLRSSSELARDS
jgi:hypothetical protein